MQEENQNQNNIPEKKILRRIAEKKQIPSQKQELIKYLTERITQAEQALQDTQQLLEKQKIKRQKITQSLSERSAQLTKLLQLDKKTLPQKIKQKLQQILTEAITAKIKAESDLKNGKQLNYEYKSILNQLKFLQSATGQQEQSIISKQQETKSQIGNIEQNLKISQDNIKQLTAQIKLMNQKKQQIQNKYLQLRVAVDRMTDIKLVLNRFFNNEQLFDNKLNFKEQTIKRPVIKDLQETKSHTKQVLQKPKLKPIEKKLQKSYQNSPNQEDFWTADIGDRRINPKQKLPSFKK